MPLDPNDPSNSIKNRALYRLEEESLYNRKIEGREWEAKTEENNKLTVRASHLSPKYKKKTSVFPKSDRIFIRSRCAASLIIREVPPRR